MANLYIEKCEKIAQSYNLKPLEAKLVLLRTSITYNRKSSTMKIGQLEELLQKIQSASKIFTENKTFGKFKDALAETLYMQAIVLTNICHTQIDEFRLHLRKAAAE